MARRATDTDYPVIIDGIGTFSFARRRMADEIKIQVEYARLIDGVEPTQWLSIVSTWIATFKVLTVKAPDDWDIDELDPFADDTYSKMKLVFDALTAKEQSFRQPNGKGSQISGPVNVGNDGILVSEKVQPDA